MRSDETLNKVVQSTYSALCRYLLNCKELCSFTQVYLFISHTKYPLKFLFHSALIVTRFSVNWHNNKIPFSWSMCSIFKVHAKIVSFSYKKNKKQKKTCTIWFEFLWQGYLLKIIPGDVLNSYSVTVCLFYALLTVYIIPNIK